MLKSSAGNIIRELEMGNRAVIAFESDGQAKDTCPAIYLHWNGGRDSVEAFLAAAKHFNLRGNDPTYGAARLTQIIGNWLGGTLSLGVGCYASQDTDNGDNGTYWIKNWKIVKREFMRNAEQDIHDPAELLSEIIEANKVYLEEGVENV
jgi:hypothetical protein